MLARSMNFYVIPEFLPLADEQRHSLETDVTWDIVLKKKDVIRRAAASNLSRKRTKTNTVLENVENVHLNSFLFPQRDI